MNELNVAVWGLGAHALKNILPALAATPGIRIAGVCSRNGPIVEATAAQYRCEGWASSDAMLRRSEVDAVFVATPIGLHFAHGLAVLTAQKHLWCEKPFVARLSDAETLIDLSRRRSVVVAEAFMYLYHSQFRALLDIAGSGRLGALCSISCRFGIPSLEHPGFRLDPMLAGGAFLDVGSYPMSLVTAFFPGIEPVVSFAEIVTAEGAPVNTSGQAVLRCAGNVVVRLEWRIGCSYRNELDLWGVDGSLATDRIFSKPADYVPSLRFRDAYGRENSETLEAQNHFVEMFACFRDLVGDPVAADVERQAIARRARLVDEIRRVAQRDVLAERG